MRHLLLLAAGVLITIGFGLAWTPLGFIAAGVCVGAAWYLLAPEVTDAPT